MAVDKELWRTLRAEWETSPKMTQVDVAVRLGITSQAVGKHIRQEGWTKYVVADVDHIAYSPRQLTEIAIRSLVRICTQTQDHVAAARAAATLLERTMGRVTAEQTTPLLKPDLDAEESAAWPEWLKARRFAYQEAGALPDSFEDPPISSVGVPAAPDSKMDEEPPFARSSIAAEAPSPLPEPFRPRIVPSEPPVRFWDRPTLPAEGAARDPNRH